MVPSGFFYCFFDRLEENMSKIIGRSFSVIVLITILLAQVGVMPVAAAAPATPPGAQGKIAVSKLGNIWLVNSTGTQWSQLTSGAGGETSPSWSSGGSLVAYVCQGNTAICTINKNGGSPYQVITSSGIGMVDWQPGSDKLLYLKAGDLWRVQGDGTNNTKLTTNGNIQSGRYSPDGSEIVYADNNGITVIDADGSNPNFLSTTTTGDESPSWSPDGSQIVFTRGSAGAGNIFVMQASDGSSQAGITSDSQAYEATWAPDGSKILITRDTGLYMVDPNGSNPTLVTSDFVRMPAWQPVNEFLVNTPTDLPDALPGDGVCETSTSSGICSLRAAIQEVNALTVLGTFTIELECGLTIAADLPSFTNTSAQKVVLEGYGYAIDGAGAYRLIDVGAGATVYLEKIVLTHGLNPTGGGAIYNAGLLYLKNTIVKENSANEGGGISNNGTLYITNSLFKDNEATAGYGGAIINLGSATIGNSTFTENTASAGGGGVANMATGNADFYNVTMTLNHSGTAVDGGGYAGLDSSTATLTNSLFVGNDGFGSGGGPEVSKAGSAFITGTSHNLFGSDSLTFAEAVVGFSLDPTDLTATSDGTNPTSLTGILDTTLSVNATANTAFHRLVYGSPAIDVGDNTACAAAPVNNFDQRGVSRPVDGDAVPGAICDIGAYEADINIFLVSNSTDSGPGSLRQAITDANGAINTPVGIDQVHFAIPPSTISPTSELPAILEAVGIDGENKIVLDGASAGVGANGLTLNSSNSVIQHLTIKNFNRAGVVVTSGSGNIITQNSIYDNNVLDIDLGDDGVTFNHAGFIAGPNHYQNYPVLDLATSESGVLRLVGSLDGEMVTVYTVQVYKNQNCHPSSFGGGKDFIGSFNVGIADAVPYANFDQTLSVVGLGEPQGVTLTATGPYGTSEFSYCQQVATPNLNWAQAKSVLSSSSTQQYITTDFQEKWFKFPVQPGAKVTVKLTNQPGSAVSLHVDPNPIYDSLIQGGDETALSAETADTAFMSAASLPVRSLSAGSLPVRSLQPGYLPVRSLPVRSLPVRSLPAGAIPVRSLPTGSLPAGATPVRSLPVRSLPVRSLPVGLLPNGSLPTGSTDAYATAALQSLVAVSMKPGATIQTIEQDTYDYLGDMYVRVVGPADLGSQFTLEVDLGGGSCSGITPVPGGLQVINGSAPGAGTHVSLILADSGRMEGTTGEISTAMAKLQTLAARPEVDGVVIDLADAQYERVNWANTQADANPTCPAAKNLVAEEIKNVIDAYREANSSTLEYIVLAGGAGSIPYFQSQDVAEVSNEKDYVVPVAPDSPSEAGLDFNLVQGQDGYGSSQQFSQAGFELPFPDLAVGRLVDSASDISTAIDAYIATGGVIQPGSSLVTGYDFVGDGAEAIKTELEAGTGATADTLIQPPNEPPNGPNTWSASDLRNLLIANHYDVISLSGHFSAGQLLAADYDTQLSASGLSLPAVDLTDTLVLTLGCHGGYTIPEDDLLTGASPNPDWAKAVLRKGAAGYIAATGYSYGDTELVEYGERLFVLINQRLRTGNNPVSVGKALMEAKRKYLANTTQMSGVDQKTIVETTLYGLPMLKVDMPGTRLPEDTDPASIVGSTTPVGSGPGAAVGLSNSPVVSLGDNLGELDITQHTLQLENLSDNSQVGTTYYSGADGVISNPYEPIYPREIHNVQVDNSILRGVAFRGGTYTDQAGVTPLTTAPATEMASAHVSFSSNIFYPTQVWMPHYSNALNGGIARLMVFPAQYRSLNPASTNGTLRIFDQIDLQLYYLPDDWSSSNVRAAAVGAAPNILDAFADEDSGDGDVDFTIHVDAEGSAGVQAVWVLYTGKPGANGFYGTWAPLDLIQDPDDSQAWTGSLPLGGEDADDLRFMVQAVGGAGLTTLDTNEGAFYQVTPETAPPPAVATTLTFISPTATSGAYSQESTFTLHLAGACPVADKLVTLDIGGQQAAALTNGSGDATIDLTVQAEPGNYTAQAAFDGDDECLGSTASSAFTLNKDTTTLSVVSTSPFVAAIKNSSDDPLAGKSIVFVLHNGGNTFVRSVHSNFQGQAALGKVPLPSGVYTVDIYFSGTIPVGPLDLNDAYYQSDSLLNAGTFTSTAPSVNITAKKADNTTYTAGTWTNQTVTVHFDCSDPDGIVFCPADQVFSADGMLTAQGTAMDSTDNLANASFGPIRVDKTHPTVVSSVRTDANPTNRANVHFTVTFSEPVTGVNTIAPFSDFSLTTSGVSGASITGVSGTGATRIITVNAGSGNGTIHLNVLNDNTIKDLAGNTLNGAFSTGETYNINKTLIFRSTGSQDGWVLESSETSNNGGTINPAATTLRLGDDATNKQYRGILSFSTGTLPDTATITSVTLKVRMQAVVGGGNPVSLFQGFMVDIKKGFFGTTALQTSDFQATFTPATGKTYGPFSPALVSNWYSINLTSGKAYINKLSTNGGLTQVRLRFTLDDNNNAVANYLSLFSGNTSTVANRPQLVITYVVP
jgi:Tol biopolymer transport system component